MVVLNRFVGMDRKLGRGGACALFGKTFQPSENLKALVYFEGGDLDDLADNERTVLVSAVKAVKKIPPCLIRSKFLVDL